MSTKEIHLLDPGAGVGSLSAAVVDRVVAAERRPVRVSVTAYELDSLLANVLRQTLEDCERVMRLLDVEFHYDVVEQDFIETATTALRSPLWCGAGQYTHVIANPPYKKIPSTGHHRKMLRSVGIEATNLYAAFVGLAVRLLAPLGELVAITPRSFCNGPYFRPFRSLLLTETGVDRVHMFEARDVAFRDDEVLQETVIFHAVKGVHPKQVDLSLSSGLDLKNSRFRTATATEVVRPGDIDMVLHLPTLEGDASDAALVRAQPSNLSDLGLSVSTGQVVEFRLRAHIRDQPVAGSVPLIYPAHFNSGTVAWPRTDIRKPNAIVRNPHSQRWLMPNGCYVLIRRFSSKEERRRIVAVVFDGSDIPDEWVGFENRLNVLHENGRGLPRELAWGLATYLNSSVVDRCFRSFNGHTQVNASDLRALQYPMRDTLCALGRRAVTSMIVEPDAIDDLVLESVFERWPGSG